MNKYKIAKTALHEVPKDIKEALKSSNKALSAWNSLSDLARNEWVCWTISVKKDETRKQHVKRVVSDLEAGKRRPCCWQGCFHREKNKKAVDN